MGLHPSPQVPVVSGGQAVPPGPSWWPNPAPDIPMWGRGAPATLWFIKGKRSPQPECHTATSTLPHASVTVKGGAQLPALWDFTGRAEQQPPGSQLQGHRRQRCHHNLSTLDRTRKPWTLAAPVEETWGSLRASPSTSTLSCSPAQKFLRPMSPKFNWNVLLLFLLSFFSFLPY